MILEESLGNLAFVLCLQPRASSVGCVETVRSISKNVTQRRKKKTAKQSWSDAVFSPTSTSPVALKFTQKVVSIRVTVRIMINSAGMSEERLGATVDYSAAKITFVTWQAHSFQTTKTRRTVSGTTQAQSQCSAVWLWEYALSLLLYDREKQNQDQKCD